MRSPSRDFLLVLAGLGIAITWTAIVPHTMTTAAIRSAADLPVSPAGAAASPIGVGFAREGRTAEERSPPDTGAPSAVSATTASSSRASSSPASSSAAITGGPAPRISPRQALKKAREALQAKDLAEALRNYENALDSDPGGATLAEALFGAGLLRLHPYHVPRDVDLGRKPLEDFEKQFPNHRYLAGALVALGLQEETNAAHVELRENIEKQRELCASETKALRGRLEAAETQSKTYAQASASQVQRIEGLEAQLTESNKALASLRAKLEEQEKALQERDRTVSKLKKALVKQRTPAAPKLPK